MLPFAPQTGMDNRPGTESTKTEGGQHQTRSFPMTFWGRVYKVPVQEAWPPILLLCGKVPLHRNGGHGTTKLCLRRKDQLKGEASEKRVRASIHQRSSRSRGPPLCWDTGCRAQTRAKVHAHWVQRGCEHLTPGRNVMPSDAFAGAVPRRFFHPWSHFYSASLRPTVPGLHELHPDRRGPRESPAECVPSGTGSADKPPRTELARRAKALEPARDPTSLLRCPILHFQTKKRFHKGYTDLNRKQQKLH